MEISRAVRFIHNVLYGYSQIVACAVIQGIHVVVDRNKASRRRPGRPGAYSALFQCTHVPAGKGL